MQAVVTDTARPELVDGLLDCTQVLRQAQHERF
jgi:hypothetical protein